MGDETHLKITHSSIMAKKKTKGKRKIVVQKRPRKKRKAQKGKKRKGAVEKVCERERCWGSFQR